MTPSKLSAGDDEVGDDDECGEEVAVEPVLECEEEEEREIEPVLEDEGQGCNEAPVTVILFPTFMWFSHS